MEHGRWNIERTRTGWRLGEKKDIERKISPYIREWSALKESIKEWDCDAVRAWPEIFKSIGFEICRENP